MQTGNDITSLVNLFRTCFYISMAVAAISLVLAVILFFKLDIRGVVRRLYGIGRKRHEKNGGAGGNTGRLAAEKLLESSDSKRIVGTGKTGRMRRTGRVGSTKRTAKAAAAAAVSPETAPMEKTESGHTVPVGNATEDFRKPDVFDYPRYEAGEAAAAAGFVLTERLVVIHTDELIEI